MPAYPTIEAFTDTYSEDSFPSPYERLEAYERVMEVAAEHPITICWSTCLKPDHSERGE